ncbi:hypothetical protein HC248_00324 [Polaromonas vacuolata]|uniref:Polymerase nucleotidyl transferase domain-containing protein n=1 Tax=Polaromonas vacuolata TaxID=37448 RepID=A0A6H2H5B2_9BURK|nr:nucleotidyltransferase domain-containing protein [Polaromonas vacuolata]QJC55061.1 hypothetical protein HC248_00324 [Polaromonas vacuolata]
MTEPLSTPRKSLLDALFGKTKKTLITTLFAHPEVSWHLRGLARASGTSPTMISKEVKVLSEAGLILDEKDGNRRRIKANPDCPIFDELRMIAKKTAGLAELVKDALASISGVQFAFIFGSLARGDERGDSDVDVCVVGSALNREVNLAMASIEESVARSVNPIVYSVEELRKKVESENHFVAKLMASKKIFLIGDDDAFGKSVGRL